MTSSNTDMSSKNVEWVACHDEVYTSAEGAFVCGTDNNPELAKYIVRLHNKELSAVGPDTGEEA